MKNTTKGLTNDELEYLEHRMKVDDLNWVYIASKFGIYNWIKKEMNYASKSKKKDKQDGMEV